jgi:hypothetical protein
MTTITCSECGHEFELSEALTKDIEKTILAAEHKKHETELKKAKAEAAIAAKKESEQTLELARKQFEGDVEAAKKSAEAEIEIARKKFEAEARASQKKASAEQELEMKALEEDAASEKKANKELREKLSELMTELREERKAKENAELEMQKKLTAEEGKIREDAAKVADEKYRLKLAESEKKLADTQKALDEAQRKAAQGSQQLQGEILELDMEDLLRDSFRDDEIEPVAKGQRGSDIRQVVKSQRGTECGVILWEIKRTKNWTEGWIQTIKTNLRSAKANLPVIVTNVMPKQVDGDIGNVNGVWVCKPPLAVILATLLRKSLLDVGLQKALAQNKGTKAEALFNYVTSHEFVQQVEAMIETYTEMTTQVQKERIAYEKFWTQREGQARKLLIGTASIIGGISGQVGATSMPRIKGLELLEAGGGEATTESLDQAE